MANKMRFVSDISFLTGFWVPSHHVHISACVTRRGVVIERVIRTPAAHWVVNHGAHFWALTGTRLPAAHQRITSTPT
jgi:hypothetical protein